MKNNSKMRTVKPADSRRNEIIKTARDMFLTMDYSETTMQQLINRLDIAKGTLYHHFSSKQEILEAVVEDIVDEELMKKETLLKNCKAGTGALEKFRLIIKEDKIAGQNEKILDNIHRHENTQLHARQLGRYIVKLAPLFAEIIKQGCDEGVFSTKHPLESAELILSGIQFLTDPGFYDWTDDQLARRMKAFSALVEKQLGAEDGSFSFLIEE